MTSTATPAEQHQHPYFSCDLLDGSKRHLSFLYRLHKTGITLQTPSVKSLHRYTELWLPLVHKAGVTSLESSNEAQQTQQRKLIPPPDIAWLWHCHRLAPSRYESYVSQRFKCTLEASPSFVFQSADKRNDADAQGTQDSWKTFYPDEPFFLDPNHCNSDLISQACRDVLDGFDLLASMQSQSTFLWHVSNSYFRNKDFVRDGIDRYYKFLLLARHQHLIGNNDALVPTYQIDLVWHTHILTSICDYNRDCLQICGTTLFHDDSLGNHDRSPGAVLDTAFRKTEALWNEHYHNEPYKVKGAMYNGEPTPDFYNYTTWNPLLPAKSTGYLAHFVEVPQTQIKLDKKGGGATSTGRTKRSKWREPSVVALSSTGEPLFLPAVESSSKGSSIFWFQDDDVDPNPYRPGYSFGDGPSGLGYYSLETKEGWELIQERLNIQERATREQLNAFQMRICLYTACLGLTSEQIEEQVELEDALAKIRKHQSDIDERLDSDGPGYWDSNQFMFTQAVLANAAGCGGTVAVNGHEYPYSVATSHYGAADGAGAGCGGYGDGGGGSFAACGGGGDCGGAACGGGGCGGGS